MSATNRAAVFGVVGFCFLLSFVAPVFAETVPECVAYKKKYDEAIAEKKTPPPPAVCDEATPVGPVTGHCVVGTSVCKGEKTAEGKDPSKPDVQVDTSKNSPTNDPDSLTPAFSPTGQEPKPTPPATGWQQSVLQGGILNSALNPPTASDDVWQSPSADSFNDLIQQQLQSDSGASSQNQDTGLGATLQRWGASVFGDGNSQTLTPVDADGQAFGDPVQVQTFNPSEGAAGSTFAQPDTSAGQKDESLCGWVCTIKEYGGKALDAVLKEFSGTAEAKPGPVSCSESTVCGSVQKGTGSWYNCGTGGDSGPCVGTHNNPLNPKDPTIASGYAPNTVVRACSGSRCINVVANDDGGFRGNANYDGGKRIADFSPAAFKQLAPLDQGVIRNLELTPVAKFSDYRSALDYANSLNQAPTPLPMGNPVRAVENAASSYYSDLPGPSIAQQFSDVSSQQIESNALAYANQTFTAAQSNPDFSTSGDTGIAVDTSSGGTGNQASVPDNFVPNQNPDFSTSGDTGIAAVTSDSLLSRPATTRSLVNFDAYSAADPFATSDELASLVAEQPPSWLKAANDFVNDPGRAIADATQSFVEESRSVLDNFESYFNIANTPDDTIGSALDGQNTDLENTIAAGERIRNAPNDSITAAVDQQEYAASLYDQAQRFATDPFLTDAELTDLQAQQLQRDIEKAYNDRLVLADAQDAAFNTQAEREAYLSAQEEIISGLIPKPETVAVTPDQIKEQVRLAQNAEKEEFMVARPADLAKILATPAISGHLSLDMLQKLKSFTNDDEFGTFTNEELEKGIEWADLPKNAYPVMAQIAKDAGFEAPPFQESNTREVGPEDTVGMSRKLEVLADRRLVATIDDMMEQNRANNPGPVGGVEFEVNKILAENPIDTWDAPAEAYRRAFGFGGDIFATSDEIADVADQANFLDNVGTLYAPLNDEPSLASTLDDNNPPIAEEPEIKVADGSSSENLKGCASESCVGGELGDSRSRPMSPEEQALQKEIKAAEAQRARLQEQLNKLPENTNVAALIKQAQEGLDAMHSDRKPTAAEARKIENGKAALDQLRQIAIGAGDPEMAKELADFRGRLASIDAKAASFAKLAAQNGGEAGAYLTSKGRELVNQLQSGVNAAKADGPSVLFETRKSDLPAQIKDTRDTIAELNSQIADNRQSFYAMQAVNTARIPDTWASQSNPSFDPPVVVSDAYTSGSAASTAYDWEPPVYASDNLFSTSGEITQVADQANFLDNVGTIVSPLSDEPSLGRVLDENNPPISVEADNPIVTSSNLGSQDTGIREVSQAIDATTKTSDTIARTSEIVKKQEEVMLKQLSEQSTALQNMSATLSDDAVARGMAACESAPSGRTCRTYQTYAVAVQTEQAKYDEISKNYDALLAYKNGGELSPDIQQSLATMAKGQGPTSAAFDAYAEPYLDAAKGWWEPIAEGYKKGEWGEVALESWRAVPAAGNLLWGGLTKEAKTAAEEFAPDSFGFNPTPDEAARCGAVGQGTCTLEAVGHGANVIGAAWVVKDIAQITPKLLTLPGRLSESVFPRAGSELAQSAGDAVVAGETRLPGVTIRQGADDLPVPRNVANENIPLGEWDVQAARPARGAATAEAEGIAAEASEQAPRVVTTREFQNPGDDLAKVANDNNAAAPRAVEPTAGEVAPAPRTPADVVPEVPTAPVTDDRSVFRKGWDYFFKSEPKPAPVVDDIVPLGEGAPPIGRDFEVPRAADVVEPPAPRVEPPAPTLADVVDSGLPGPAPRFDLNPVLTAAEPAAAEAAVPKPSWLRDAAGWAWNHPKTTLGGLTVVAAKPTVDAIVANSDDVPATSAAVTPSSGAGKPVPTGAASPGKETTALPPDGGGTPPPPGGGVPPKDGTVVSPPGTVTKPPVVPPSVHGGGDATDPPADATVPPPYKPPVVEPRPGAGTPRPDNSNTSVPPPTNPERGGGQGGGIGGLFSGLMSALSNLFGGSQSSPTTPTRPVTPTPVPTTPPATASSTKPLVTLVANPATIPSAGTSRLVWSSISADQCALFRNGIRMGVVSTKGATTTPPLSRTTSFTVRCATTAGIVGSATTTVSVPSGSGSGAESATPAASTEDIPTSSNTDTSSNSNTDSDEGCDPTWNLVSYANCLLGK